MGSPSPMPELVEPRWKKKMPAPATMARPSATTRWFDPVGVLAGALSPRGAAVLIGVGLGLGSAAGSSGAGSLGAGSLGAEDVGFCWGRRRFSATARACNVPVATATAAATATERARVSGPEAGLRFVDAHDDMHF